MLRRLLTILRGSLHTIVIAVVALVVAFYLSIHFNLAGMLVKHSLSNELAEQLGTRVTVQGDVSVDWLNQVVLNQLTIYDQQDDTLLYARRAMVAYDLWPLLSHHLVLNTCQLIDFDLRAYRASADSAANYQFIIDALAKKDPDSTPFIQKLDLNAILLRQGRLSYHVQDQPYLSDSPIDPHHVQVSALSANVHVHDNQLVVKKFHCLERETAFRMSRCELALNVGEVLKAPRGEGRFLFAVKGLEASGEELSCKADLNGTSDDITLHLSHLDLPYGHPRLKAVSELHTSADVRLSQYRNAFDSIYVNAGIRNLSLRVDTLGSMHLGGTFEGTLCHANVSCQMESDLGNADVNATLDCLPVQADDRKLSHRRIAVKGHCRTPGFDLAKVMPAKAQLGTTALDADFTVVRHPQQPLQVGLNGMVRQLEWRGYAYHDVKVNGSVQSNRMRGDLSLNDSLGNVKANFDIDMTHPRHHYQVDGAIIHLNPNGLHLTDSKYLDSLSLTGRIHADVAATNWQHAEGEVALTYLCLEKGDQLLELDPLNFEGTLSRGVLSSPFVNLQYDRNRRTQEYHLRGEVPAANELFEMLRLPLAMNREGKFDVRIDSCQHVRSAHVELPALDLQKGRAIAATLDAKGNAQGVLSPVLDFEALTRKHRLAGTVRSTVRLDTLDVLLQPTALLFDTTDIHITDAHLRSDAQGGYFIENVHVTGGQQELSAAGHLGKEGDQELKVSLRHFDLDQVFSNFEKKFLHFGGRVTGELRLSHDQQLRLTADSLHIHRFAYIDTIVGDACLNVDYKLGDKQILITGDILTDQRYRSGIYGDIYLGKRDSMDLQFDVDHLPIGFINNWTGNILQQFCGRGTGFVRLYGPKKKLQLEGHPYVDGRFTHNVIGAHFHLADTVRLDPNLIHLDNAHVDDCHGHPLVLNARIPHQYLKHFDYDVNIKLPNAPQGFLVLDRQPVPGRIYWGQLYVQGEATLKGSGGKHRFDIRVAPTERSWFYLSPGEQDMNPDQAAYTFLTFRDKARLALDAMMAEASASSPAAHTIQQSPKKSGGMDLEVVLRVNATDQCQVYFQMDPLSEDKFICRGHGDLSVNYDPKRDIKLTGQYNIDRGTYTMNIKGDLVTKILQLQNTSYIKFDGLPSNAEINLDCLYNIPSVNLNDLDESIATLGSLSRTTVPVDCQLNIFGPMSKPDIKFDLEVKNVSDDIQAYVRNVIGTQEMMNQEVLYLLIFSKFYTPQYVQSNQSHTGSELTSLASSTITSQVNQLLNRISDNVTMGTNFRSDKGDFSDMEMDVSLSTRLLGDRLQLSGNVGYRDPANRIGTMNNSTSFIGDFDIEYRINRSGTIRAKAYSHYNERDYSINNALTTQGIGFILHKDFRSIRDFWPWSIWDKVPIPALPQDTILVQDPIQDKK